MAADEAAKATNTRLLVLNLPVIRKVAPVLVPLSYLVAYDVSDVRRSVEVALRELEQYLQRVYMNEAGQWRFNIQLAGEALVTPVGHQKVKPGWSFRAPAAIGVVMADTAVKSANVDVVGYRSPSSSAMSNEVILQISGDSGAVKQAVKAARDVD